GRRRTGRPFERAAAPRVAGFVTKLVASPDADAELDQHRGDADRDYRGAEAGDDEPYLQAGVVEHAHPAGHAHQAKDVERHEGEPEARHPAPEADLAPEGIEAEAE